VAGRVADGLLDEVERQRADENARAEAHDQPDHPQTNVNPSRECGAEQE
jgi:hypothetical protein